MRLIAYMKPYAHWVIFALLLVLGLTAFDLYRPMLVGDAIDTFGANGDYDVIIATAIKYAVVLALSFAFNVAQTWILQKTGQNIILQMRKDLYRHIQSLGSRYFDITPVGKLVTRVTNDVEALNEMYSGILVQLFRNIVKIVGLAGVMLVLDVRLAAISFVLMPLVIGLTVLCQKIARNIYRLYRTRLTDINTFLSEHLSGTSLIESSKCLFASFTRADALEIYVSIPSLTFTFISIRSMLSPCSFTKNARSMNIWFSCTIDR